MQNDTKAFVNESNSIGLRFNTNETRYRFVAVYLYGR